MALHGFSALTFLYILTVPTLQTPVVPMAENGSSIPEKEDYVLNNDVIPNKYKLRLTLPKDFYEKKKFTGVVEITLEIKDIEVSEKPITLNFKALGFDRTKITLYDVQDGNKNNLLNSLEAQEIPRLERVVFPLIEGARLNKSKTYILKISYKGDLYEDMYGIYLSSYKLYQDETQRIEWLVATHFHPTHARRAFPCFDEPKYKAEFEISITHPFEYTSISNGHTSGRHNDEEGITVTTTFEKTPKMSTYLVAFLVSKLEYINESNAYVINNSAWTRPVFKEQLQYGHGIVASVIEKLNTFTKLKYTDYMKKLDQVVLPDLAVVAMENWGLVTYRESTFLWDKDESPAKIKQTVASSVAHELSHMWFGNLITFDWWSAAWLNEGFARYFEYFITDKLEPKWEMDKQFVIEQQRIALIDDASDASHPLTLSDDKVLLPSQFSDMFDSITYSKGASVIRMLENLLGEEIFLEGIQNYSRSYQTKNVVPDNLWESFDKAKLEEILPSQQRLKKVMDSWMSKAGYPIVTVNQEELTNNVEVTQERFYYYSADFQDESEMQQDSIAWYIPITYKLSADLNNVIRKWLIPEQELKITDALKHSKWILLNIKDSGYYRVNYHNKLWEALIENALNEENYKTIDVLNRAQLVDDALNLARAGKLKYEIAFDVASYLKIETDYYVWHSAFAAFSYIRKRFNSDEEVADLLNNFIRDLMKKLYESIPFEEVVQDHISIYKRTLALKWGCELGKEDCVRKSKEMFKSFRTGTMRIHPDLRSVVYCYGIRYSENNLDWAFLKQRLLETQIASELSIIISALGCTTNETELEEYLTDSINSGIRKQDVLSVYSAVINGNPKGATVALKFFILYFNVIQVKYGDTNSLSSIISLMADRFTTIEQIDTLEKFVKSHRDELGEAALAGDHAIETARLNLKWTKENKVTIFNYLDQALSTSTSPSSSSSSPLSSTISEAISTPSSTISSSMSTADSTTKSTITTTTVTTISTSQSTSSLPSTTPVPSTTPSEASAMSACTMFLLVGIFTTIFCIF